jgi:hypothetical protein
VDGGQALHRAAAAWSEEHEGRPMYAALRAIPVVGDVVARLFHAGSL